MSTSANAMKVARNGDFQDRIRHQLAVAAVAVAAEDAGTTGHAARRAYAAKVLDGTADFAAASVVVMTNSTLAGKVTLGQDDFGIPDSDLPFTVNSVFNALAGI